MNALPTTVQFDLDALRWFTGVDTGRTTRSGKPIYQGTRCELNAFSADELAAFIEDGLAREGADAKLLPPADVLDSHAEQARTEALTDLVAEEIARRMDVGAIVAALIEDYPELGEVTEVTVRERLTERRTLSWRAAADRIIAADIAAR